MRPGFPTPCWRRPRPNTAATRWPWGGLPGETDHVDCLVATVTGFGIVLQGEQGEAGGAVEQGLGVVLDGALVVAVRQMGVAPRREGPADVPGEFVDVVAAWPPRPRTQLARFTCGLAARLFLSLASGIGFTRCA